MCLSCKQALCLDHVSRYFAWIIWTAVMFKASFEILSLSCEQKGCQDCVNNDCLNLGMECFEPRYCGNRMNGEGFGMTVKDVNSVSEWRERNCLWTLWTVLLLLCVQPGWEERTHSDGRVFYIDHSKYTFVSVPGCNSSLVVCSARCPAWCSVMGLILPGEFFVADGIFFLELAWVLTPISPKTVSD